jgi:hypothetical protein
MARELDEQAAKQVERLFHAEDCLVWDVDDVPWPMRQGDVPLSRADGAVVGVARPAPEHVECRLPRVPGSSIGQASVPAADVVAPRRSTVSSVVMFALGLLVAIAVLLAAPAEARVGTPGAISRQSPWALLIPSEAPEPNGLAAGDPGSGQHPLDRAPLSSLRRPQ